MSKIIHIPKKPSLSEMINWMKLLRRKNIVFAWLPMAAEDRYNYWLEWIEVEQKMEMTKLGPEWMNERILGQ